MLESAGELASEETTKCDEFRRARVRSEGVVHVKILHNAFAPIPSTRKRRLWRAQREAVAGVANERFWGWGGGLEVGNWREELEMLSAMAGPRGW